MTGFADDSGLVFSAETWVDASLSAGRGMEVAKHWMNVHKLSLNTTKTKFIAFAPSSASLPGSEVVVRMHDRCDGDGEVCSCACLGRVESICYLGVHIDSTLKYNTHIQSVVRKVRRSFYIFLRLRNILSQPTMIMIYNSIIQSILSYGLLIWGSARSKYIKQVEIVQKSILKIILKQNRRYPSSQVFEDSRVCPLRHLYVRQLAILAFHNRNKDIPTHAYSTRQCHLPRPPAARTNGLARNPHRLAARLFPLLPPDISFDLDISHKGRKGRIKRWLAGLSATEFDEIWAEIFLYT